jgi:hypothetical protein
VGKGFGEELPSASAPQSYLAAFASGLPGTRKHGAVPEQVVAGTRGKSIVFCMEKCVRGETIGLYWLHSDDNGWRRTKVGESRFCWHSFSSCRELGLKMLVLDVQFPR